MKERIKERVKKYKELKEQFWTKMSEYPKIRDQINAVLDTNQDWDAEIEGLKELRAIRDKWEQEIDTIQDEIEREIDFFKQLLYETGLNEIRCELEDATVLIRKEGDPRIIYKPGQGFTPKGKGEGIVPSPNFFQNPLTKFSRS